MRVNRVSGANKRPHRCFAAGCTAEVSADRLMCSRHWRMVPAGLRQAIGRTWRSGNVIAHASAKYAAARAVHAIETARPSSVSPS